MASEDFDELMRIQRQMAGRIVQESDDNLKLKMMDIVNDLVGNRNKPVQVELVILEADNEGIQEEDCLSVLDELVDLGFLSRPEDGFVQRG